MNENPPPSSNAPVPDNAGPHTEPDDREEVYYHGPPPIRAHAGAVAASGFIALVLVGLAVLLVVKHVGPVWMRFVLIVLALAMPLIPLILSRVVSYRVTNYRIDYERGLLSKTIDTLELWHVEDLHFYQSFLDRMLNVGTITVVAKDDTMPRLEMFGLPNPRPLYETLKQRVIAVKRQRGVIKMDPG